MQQGAVYAFLVCGARSLGAGSDPGEDIGNDGLAQSPLKAVTISHASASRETPSCPPKATLTHSECSRPRGARLGALA
jgi:hypothetical protein